jgi:hypothetical protein
MLASLPPATPCAGGWAAGAMNDEWTSFESNGHTVFKDAQLTFRHCKVWFFRKPFKDSRANDF